MNEVVFKVSGPIAIVTINRPEQMNAISRAVIDQLYTAWARFEADDSLKVAILTGAGERAFSAGIDLKEASSSAPRARFPILGDNVQVSKPVIAAVNGTALAGGWLLAQMCDLCIATETATFGIPEVKVGRGVPWAAPLFGMIPQRVAMELLLTGNRITAQRAYEIGFVNQVVPAAQLMPAATELATTIAENAPLSVMAAKELLQASADMGLSAARKMGETFFRGVYASEDAKEGPRAFTERRRPVWKGC